MEIKLQNREPLPWTWNSQKLTYDGNLIVGDKEVPLDGQAQTKESVTHQLYTYCD